MTTFSSYTLDYSISGTTYSTYLTGIRGDNIVGMYVDANGLDHGLLYDLQLGSWTNIDFPGAASTVPYGPSFGTFATGMDIVGSYKLSGQQTDNGFLLDRSASSGSTWTTLDYPGASNTIPHSTFNGLIVGNWDVLPSANPDFQTIPVAGNAFIYNIATGTFTTNDKPGALSTTAYGIYDDKIAGGYADTPATGGIQPEHGYIYDMSTKAWTTYDHPGAIITHFDGITGGDSPGAYTLIGDWLGVSDAANSPLHAFVLHVKDGIALDWTDFAITGSVATSGNSVYGNTAVGVYLTDPSTGVNGYVATVPCFASGTRIATPSGMVAVEELRPGMLVSTATDKQVPIKWIGCRKVACRTHPDPASVWPVRVRAGAFDDDAPVRDLWLSADHAVFANGVLIPIKHLIDGAAIAQVPRDVITYWHIELAHHDILLAEGLPVESYLDTGDRSAFINGGGVVTFAPDFAVRVREAEGCAPLVVTGTAFAAVQQQLAARLQCPAQLRERRTKKAAPVVMQRAPARKRRRSS
jgi:hypothetical protein